MLKLLLRLNETKENIKAKRTKHKVLLAKMTNYRI